MFGQLRPAIVSLALFTILTGLAYPLIVTGIAQGLFPSQANGSLMVRNGKAIGSVFIGQPFDDPKYFWGRLSATTPFAYNAAASSGSNLGPMNEALSKTVQSRVDVLRAADPGNEAPIPVDLATASEAVSTRTSVPPQRCIRCDEWPERAALTKTRFAALSNNTPKTVSWPSWANPE
jgi:K+-transporting ATPase KdpC subunit